MEQVTDRIKIERGDMPDNLYNSFTKFTEMFENAQKEINRMKLQSYSNTCRKMSDMEKAKFDLILVYGINSLFWMYLKVQGLDPVSFGLREELQRVRQAMQRIRLLTDGSSAESSDKPKTDPSTAKRMVKHALWTPKQKKRISNSQTPDQQEPKIKKECLDVSENDGTHPTDSN